MGLMAPVSAYPLGVGDIKLYSALNQTLNAEISLLLSPEDNISDLVVKLAPAGKFEEAGVPWNFFLTKIKFEPKLKANGTAYIELSSDEILREPFLDFLVEVSWSKGNLYREYTVLVDPPATYTEPVLTQISAPEQSNQRINRQVQSDSEYGPIQPYDTLWTIAENVNQHSDVSIEQMMMALYEKNPNAFFKQNVNALKANQILSVPSKDEISRLSKQQAVNKFRVHNAAWTNRTAVESAQKSKDTTRQSSVVAKAEPEREVNPQLELEAPFDTEIDIANLGPESESLDTENLAPDNQQSERSISIEANLALQERMEKLEQQLLMMQRMMAIKDEQLAALQSKSSDQTDPVVGNEVTPAEKPVSEASVKPGPSLKDSLPGPPQTVTPAITKPEVAVKPVQNQPKVIAKEPTVKTPTATKPKAVSKPKPVAGNEGLIDSALATFLTIAGAVIIAILGWLWWRKKKVEEVTDTESMFATASEITLPDSSVEELAIPIIDEADSYDVGTVGESSFLSEFTPSDFDAFDTDQNEVDPISEADVYLAYGRFQQAEDLMRQAIEDQPDRDECKLKLLEIFYANENKEAFGTYTKELINQGKQNDQIFWSTVTEMGLELDSDSQLYNEFPGEKAHFDLDDENKSANEDNSENQPDENEVGFDLSVFDDDSTAVNESQNVDSAELKADIIDSEGSIEEADLDFDLDMFKVDETLDDLNPESIEQEINEIKEETGITESEIDLTFDESDTNDSESVEFDLSDVSLDSSFAQSIDDTELDDSFSLESELDEELILEESPIEAENSEKVETELESFNFDLVADDESEPNPEADIEDFEFSLENESESLSEKTDDDLSLDGMLTESVSEDSENKGSTDQFDDFEFDFDQGISSSDSETDELGLGVSDLTDMDELETKIDLAKAYVDMGDNEAAKDIAEEVIEKGNEKQKQSAQSILDKLN